MGLKAKPRWRLTFNADDPQTMRVLKIGAADRGAVDEAVTLFRAAVRSAMDAGGCRTVMVGVHVEGEACDHEVGR
jgi:hypothetical protein